MGACLSQAATAVYHPKPPTRNSLALIFMRAACDTE